MLKMNVNVINARPIDDIIGPTPGIIAYPEPIVLASRPLAGYMVP